MKKVFLMLGSVLVSAYVITVLLTIWSALPSRSQPAPLKLVPRAPAERVIDISTPDLGGFGPAYETVYQMFARAGFGVRVASECTSACVLLFVYFPAERICVTPEAKLGMHLATVPDPRTRRWVPDPKFTAEIMKRYPQWMRDETAALGRLELKVKYIPFAALQKHVAVCAA